MSKRIGFLLALVLLVIFAALFFSGCRPTEMEVVEEAILSGEGVLVNRVDAHTIEIASAGQLLTFELEEGVSVSGIEEGSTVAFTYREGDPKPVLVSISVLYPADDPDHEPEPAPEPGAAEPEDKPTVESEPEMEVLRGEGIYVGQIDNISVEIEVRGEPLAFELDAAVTVDTIESGAGVVFTYVEGAHRPRLLSIETSGGPSGGSDAALSGAGILVGQIDANSVEIELDRVFSLGEGLSALDIPTGSQVAFSFAETGRGAVLETIETAEIPVEGTLTHGTLVEKVNGQQVKIRYSAVFALGEGVLTETVGDGSNVVFTYQLGPNRPMLTSLGKK